MGKPVMLCIGSAAQDVFLEGDVLKPKREDGKLYEYFKLGEKLSLEKITFTTGGNAMNASVTFARQGLETNFIGLLGEDPAGQAVLGELDRENVGTKHVTSDARFTTSYSVILLAPSGERTILNYHGEPLSSQAETVSGAEIAGDWLYVSSIGSMPFLKKIMKETHAKNIKIAFNPASFELKHIQDCADLLKYVTLFAVNYEEAKLFVEGASTQELASALSKSVEYVLVSDGPRGAVATDGVNLVAAGMYEDVPVIDRTGAGDAFTSGFVSQIALGKSLEEAITFASANSTSVVGKIGAKAGILKSNAKLHDMPLKSSRL